MNFWQTFLVALGGNSVLLIALGFIARSFWGALLQRDLERYRSDLKREHDRELAQLKTRLEIAANDHSIRFSKFHDRAAATIAATYSRLVHLRAAVGEFVSIESSTAEENAARLNQIKVAAQELWRVFEPRRIFIAPSLAERITALRLKMFSVANEYELGVVHCERSDSRRDVAKLMIRLRSEIIETEAILRELERDIQMHLGVTPEQKTEP